MRKTPAGILPGAEPIAAAGLTLEQLKSMIAREAYFRAEKRGFAPGGELQDWLAAETEIARQLGQR